ncbi:MAG: hypothetical protein A2Y38_12150 [Spirochaetes bacterium GWB1_59_5]|nr:MAG: hypothetical protein A2Y38_12150 [Spirochaetes bacterium GWB1_59_5]
MSTVAGTGSYTDLTNKPAGYTLPTATTTVLGGVKPDGSSIVIDGAGVISSTVSAGVSSFNSRTGAVTSTAGDYAVIDITGLGDALTGKEPANANIQSHIGSTANPHSVTKAQVGLGSVDNTSDAAKPVSTATQNALDLKADTSSLGTAAYLNTGTTAGTVASGDDDRITGALQPGAPATFIANTPAGSIAATNVQGAIDELASEKATAAQGTRTYTTNNAAVQPMNVAISSSAIAPNGVIYAGVGSDLKSSSDNGVTWVTLKSFANASEFRAIYAASNGYIYASAMNSYGAPFMDASLNGLWRSVDGTNFTRVIALGEAECIWGLDEDSTGNIYAGAYTLATSPTNDTVYKSGDNGGTWSTVYDGSYRHVHSVSVDRSTDYVYVAMGDTSYTDTILRSTNGGASFAVIMSDLPQMTAMVASPTARLFGTDKSPLGRIYRTTNDTTYAVTLDTHYQNCFFLRRNPATGNIYAGFKLDPSATTNFFAGLYVSRDDGVTWNLIRTLDSLAVGEGIWFASEFSAGKILVGNKYDGVWQRGLIVDDSAITTIANVGTGEGSVFKERVDGQFRLKTIKAGSNVTVTNNENDVTVSATASGGASAFSDLTDAFALAGNGGKVVQVNAGATALEPGQNLTPSGTPQFAKAGIGAVAESTSYLFINPTLSSGESALKITATAPSSPSATVWPINVAITSAGAASFRQAAGLIQLLSGYTGTSGTYGLNIVNGAAGTSTNIFDTGSGNQGNIALRNLANGTTTGTNSGIVGMAYNGDTSYGLIGLGGTSTKNNAVYVGVAGFAVNGGTTPTRVGGYFGLNTTTPVYVEAGLIADNAAVSAPIFIGRDSGTEVFRIADGGNVGIGTTTPSEKLEVTGNIKASGDILESVQAPVTENNLTATAAYSKLTVTTTAQRTVTLPAVANIGMTTKLIEVCGTAVVPNVAWAAGAGSVTWGDTGAPTFTSGKCHEISASTTNYSVTSTAAWRLRYDERTW